MFFEIDQNRRGVSITGISTHPYHQWESDSNENLNWLIRSYFTKSPDFTAIAYEEIEALERKLNKRLQKKCGYESPVAMMSKLLAKEHLHERLEFSIDMPTLISTLQQR